MKKILFTLISMSLLVLTSCARGEQATIINGDFESGDFTGWTVVADPIPKGVLDEPIGGEGAGSSTAMRLRCLENGTGVRCW